MENKKLIIWDFDGVIALNSEVITMELLSQWLKNKGLDLSTQECLKKFSGLNGEEINNFLLEKYKVSLNKKAVNFIRSKRIERYQEGKLKKPQELIGILKYLQNNQINFCIASNSPKKTLSVAIESLNLNSYFNLENNVFSSELTENNKKLLYSYIFKKYNIEQNNCIVIEDSLNGVKFAKSVGINDVIGFTGGDHILNKFTHRENLNKECICVIENLNLNILQKYFKNNKENKRIYSKQLTNL